MEIGAGRRAGYAVVLEPATHVGFEGPQPLVLTADRQVRRVSVADVPGGVRTVTRIKVPKGFNGRNAPARRDLAARLREALPDAAPVRHGRRGARGPEVAQGDDAELAQLRRRLRAHPCHACPDREEHARWAERWDRLHREHDALVARIEGRTSSIARVFDRICDVLQRLGYLAVATDTTAVPEAAAVDTAAGAPGRRAAAGDVHVTSDGQWLRRLYAENDLLVAECLRRGAWDELDPAGLAAAVSTVVYSARRDDRDAEPHVPGGPQGKLARALDETVRIWSELDDLESEAKIESTGPLDLGLVESVHRWASGRSLDAVLKGSDLAAGDFVRWCKQVIDLLDQLSQAAPNPRVRDSARRGVTALRRGVVSYSSL